MSFYIIKQHNWFCVIDLIADFKSAHTKTPPDRIWLFPVSTGI